MQMGGGFLVTAGLLGGAIVGTMLGQSSAGLVVGLILGVAGAVLLGVWDARRKR